MSLKWNQREWYNERVCMDEREEEKRETAS